MIALSVSTMIIGTFMIIPVIIGKDTVVNAADSLDLFLNHLNALFLFSSTKMRTALALFWAISSSLFWYYWSSSSLKDEISFVLILGISLIAVFLAYLIYKYFLRQPVVDILRIELSSIALFIVLLCSIALIWIPSILYLTCRIWKSLANLSVKLSGLIGYLLFEIGLFLFLISK